MAPEVSQTHEYSFPADVFSFGIIMFEVLTREQAYLNYFTSNKITKIDVLKNKINSSSEKLRPSTYKPIDPFFKQLMEQCWDHNPLKRPTFEEIVKSPWFDGLEQIDKENYELWKEEMVEEEEEEGEGEAAPE